MRDLGYKQLEEIVKELNFTIKDFGTFINKDEIGLIKFINDGDPVYLARTEGKHYLHMQYKGENLKFTADDIFKTFIR